MLRNALEPWHLIVVVLVLVVVFGSKKLPDMARALGKSARILKSEAKAMKDDPAPASVQTPAAPAPASGAQNPITPTVVDSHR
ncbi:Sec-independent protein translocase subunit TatA [Streptomyces sp. AV19]|uniref:Sec-independent protein translocase subunit TatA n=1 Tax=Streptomyces sp. AV19 TaxID=2793068 RepID=UPI0018FE1351|nr:Sec-independent protein translocase subunit TatA [Streptomyces sp. AV19]MBH1937072.1 Sec-independent protein translocase subunit TatA [Streptomyces sp. AV19]MDG4535911.1 Sec-independent protein translocase subunit TatA [Streptomyces sp. AV19]